MQSPSKRKKARHGRRAWVILWANREDKVEKRTGTVICLLPSTYDTKTVRRIVEAIYCCYVYSYEGHLDYACFRKRNKNPLSQVTFDSRVIIPENPGLVAVLADDVVVESNTSGILQTISWTYPDFYEPGPNGPVKTQNGTFRSLTFDFLKFEQTDDPKEHL